MTSEEEKFEVQRHGMVECQLKARGISDERILQAFQDTPREAFVPPRMRSETYADHPLPIGSGQTISQPYVVALMLQELNLAPGQRVLDVGAGSGYQCALLGQLAGEVYGIERIEELAHRAQRIVASIDGLENVHIVCGDGSMGLPAHAPFDRIICGAAAPEIPPPWTEQLAEAGRLVAPVGSRGMQTLEVLEKQHGQIQRRKSISVRFVPLIGEQGFGESA